MFFFFLLQHNILIILKIVFFNMYTLLKILMGKFQYFNILYLLNWYLFFKLYFLIFHWFIFQGIWNVRNVVVNYLRSGKTGFLTLYSMHCVQPKNLLFSHEIQKQILYSMKISFTGMQKNEVNNLWLYWEYIATYECFIYIFRIY
jgi:hypothetical protein